MASSRAIKAARAFVEVFADDSKLRRTLKGTQQQLRAFAASVTKIGGLVSATAGAMLTPLIAATFKFQTAGDAIDKMAARTGVGAAALSQLGFAAEQTGADLATLEKGFFGLSRSTFDLERGSAEATDAFDKLGLSFDDLKDLNPDEQLAIVAEQMKGLTDASTRGAVAQKIFGRAGRQLLPLLSSGAGGIAALREEADRLGLTIGAEQAKSAAEFTDAWNRVKRTIAGVALQVGAALAPALTNISDRVASTVTTVIQWVQANGELVRQLAAGVAVAGAFGGALIAVGGTAAAASLVIGGLGSAFGLMSAAITAAGATVATVGAGLTALTGALLSPVGLLTAAIAGIGIATVSMSGAGTKALAFLTEAFAPVAGRVTEAFGAIKDALKSGQYVGAARILLLSLQEAFVSGMQPIREAWIGFSEGFLIVWDKMFGELRIMFADWQGYIADQLIALQGLFDDGLNVEEIQQTRKEDTERRISTIRREIAESPDKREAQTVAAMTAIQADIKAARAELEAAKLEAQNAAGQAKGVLAVTKGEPFTDLVAGIRNAANTVKQSQAFSPATSSGDLRTAAGARVLIDLANKLNKFDPAAMSELQEQTAKLGTLVDVMGRPARI